MHSEKSKSKSKPSAAVKSQGRQYVSQAQQPAQSMAGNQQTYGQYPSGYGTGQTQYDQQQYDQQQQQITGQQMPSRPANKGHTGALYSHRPVPDHDSKFVSLVCIYLIIFTLKYTSKTSVVFLPNYPVQ